MKLSVVAIHEAGHVVLALRNGFKIKEVYISEGGGHTAIEYSTIDFQKQQVIDEPTSSGMKQILKMLDEIKTRADFGLSVTFDTGRLDFLTGKQNNLIDVYLAGWAAEEVFSSYFSIDSVSRAQKDIKAICDIIGLQGYGEIMTTYVMRQTPHYSLWRKIDGLQDSRLTDPTKDAELQSWAVLMVSRKDTVKEINFGTRDHKLKGLNKVELKALAKKLTKKKRLSGSEAERCLRDSRMSWEFKWNSFLGDLVGSVRSNYERVIIRILPIRVP